MYFYFKFFFFFFNDTATTEIYTLSLHDALPIWPGSAPGCGCWMWAAALARSRLNWSGGPARTRSEEHTSELQSRLHLVCRLLLGKKTPRPNPLRNRDRIWHN